MRSLTSFLIAVAFVVVTGRGHLPSKIPNNFFHSSYVMPNPARSMCSRGTLSNKRFVSLEHVLCALPGSTVVLQPRNRRWKFGCINYGEVCGNMYNAADGDKWDIFAPGFSTELPTREPFVVDKVLGVFMLQNGNHKIAVLLANASLPYDPRRSQDEIRRFKGEYTRRMKLKGHWSEAHPRHHFPLSQGQGLHPRHRAHPSHPVEEEKKQ
jgi:hypothetical protein